MKIDFNKMNGLVPAIIQDAQTDKVLMLGFMNEEAYNKTVETGKVTFWSRSRNTLWTKEKLRATSSMWLRFSTTVTKIHCSSRQIL